MLWVIRRFGDTAHFVAAVTSRLFNSRKGAGVAASSRPAYPTSPNSNSNPELCPSVATTNAYWFVLPFNCTRSYALGSARYTPENDHQLYGLVAAIKALDNAVRQISNLTSGGK